VGGLELSYRAHGTGPVLVLLHAFPLNKAMWDAQVRDLSDHCHVVTLDVRGFGASQTTDGEFSLDDLASDVHGLLAKLGHGRDVLGGLSMGGYVAFAFMRRYPEAVRGLVLADTKATADTPEAFAKRVAMIDEVGAQGLGGVARRMPATLVSPSTPARDPALMTRLTGWIAETNPVAVIGAQRALGSRPDQTGLLADIRVPTLVIVGEDDAVTPPSDARAMATAIPGATLVTIPAAGHLSNLEQPDAFNAALRAFMAQFRG
jgi:pimeloyl-ACP methyl ester carboxylesterase